MTPPQGAAAGEAMRMRVGGEIWVRIGRLADRTDGSAQKALADCL